MNKPHSKHYIQRKTKLSIDGKNMLPTTIPSFINNEWILITKKEDIINLLPSFASNIIVRNMEDFNVWVHKTHHKLNTGIYEHFISSLISQLDRNEYMLSMMEAGFSKDNMNKQTWYVIKQAVESYTKKVIEEDWDNKCVKISGLFEKSEKKTSK